MIISPCRVNNYYVQCPHCRTLSSIGLPNDMYAITEIDKSDYSSDISRICEYNV